MITDNPKEFWNRVSNYPNWREFILPKRTNREFENEGMDEAMNIQEYIKDDDIILEYGCGIGRILKYIKAKRKIGIDISEKYIEMAKIDNTSEYYITDDFDEKVDFIYCLSVVQHNTHEEREKIIKNIHKLLNNGGMALISFPHEDSNNYVETAFLHKFTKKEIRDYAKIFNKYKITEGNLVNYKDGNDGEYNEYFLIAIK